MIRYSSAIFLVLILGLLVSCKTEKQKEALSRIDEIFIGIDSLENKLNSKEVNDYRLLYDTIKKHNTFFINLDEDIARSEELYDIAYNYGTVEKTFKKLHSHHLSAYQKDLDILKNQLSNLKLDIENNLLTDDEIEEYLSIEENIYTDIEFKIIDKLKYARANYEKYQKYHPQVKELIESYDYQL